MGPERLPRLMLSAWVAHKRPAGAPQLTYGRTVAKAMDTFDLDPARWPELAADRGAWPARCCLRGPEMLDTVEGVCGYTVIQCIQPKSGYNADTMADTKVQSILGYKLAELYAARTAAMPPVANPNPDRARRGANIATLSEGGKSEVVPEPLMPIGAPAAAPRVV